MVTRDLPSEISFKDLHKENLIGCLTVCFDTKLVGERRFPEIRKRQDYGLWLQILKDELNCKILNGKLAVYHKQASQFHQSNQNLYFNYDVSKCHGLQYRVRPILFY